MKSIQMVQVADMIYRLLSMLAGGTIYEVQKRGAFLHQLEFARKNEPGILAGKALDSAYANLCEWGLEKTPLGEELRRWKAMH